MEHTNISKYISLILRHKPEVAGIHLDEHGWADCAELVSAIKISMEVLEEIVQADSKQRYSFNEDKTKIRANQGHSINVDVELKEMEPPSILYHGTSDRFIENIQETGIQKQSRQYVHLSIDKNTAEKVGTRHGKLVMISIDAQQMYKDGYRFFISKNNVWLTDNVPVKYIKRL